MFMRLPYTLLITSLALAASALPVESVELLVLTPDTFKQTVSEGVWFIEHFSPYCHHCKAFKPTWEKLVEHYESMPDPGVRLAQIDCAANGDLCNEHGVTGYPQMNIYRNGIFVSKFKGAREWDILTSFVDGYAEHSSAVDTVVSSEIEEKDLTSVASDNQRQVPPKKSPNSSGMVKSVDAEGLKSLMDEGPVFVKFYAPWCGHCKKLAPVWTQLASRLTHKLNIAEVNCDQHSDLCKSQGVKGYPSLFFYTGGSGDAMHKTEYSGGRKFEQLRRFAEMALEPGVLEIKNDEEYEQYVKESPIVYLLLHDNDDTASLELVKRESHVLLGSPTILTSSNTSLRARFALPSMTQSTVLLAIKDGIPFAYTSLFSFVGEDATSDGNARTALSSWLLRHKLPSAVGLSADTFQEVMNAPHHPLVVLLAVQPAGEKEAGELAKHAAKAWRNYKNSSPTEERDVVFSWMDAERWKDWMKSMYGITSETLPAVVVTDHQNLLYFDTNAQGEKIEMETESILKAVDAVLAGQVSPKYSENIFERFARKLNNGLLKLEQVVVAHPYRTALLAIFLFGAFVVAVKRFIKDDVTPYAEYTKMQKTAGRLD